MRLTGGFLDEAAVRPFHRRARFLTGETYGCDGVVAITVTDCLDVDELDQPARRVEVHKLTTCASSSSLSSYTANSASDMQALLGGQQWRNRWPEPSMVGRWSPTAS